MRLVNCEKKDYYSKLLEDNSNNIKETWGIIKKNKTGPPVTNYFDNGQMEIHEINKIANEFNNYFVNLGPNLANSIPNKPDYNITSNIKNNSNTMLLYPVTSEEIKKCVKGSKNKRSTDCDDLDMTLIKDIIDYVIHPLSYSLFFIFHTRSLSRQDENWQGLTTLQKWR